MSHCSHKPSNVTGKGSSEFQFLKKDRFKCYDKGGNNQIKHFYTKMSI